VQGEGEALWNGQIISRQYQATRQMIEEIWAKVPEAEMEKLPTNLVEQHDHYIYGLPKRTA
jgi:hypothetical protein